MEPSRSGVFANIGNKVVVASESPVAPHFVYDADKKIAYKLTDSNSGRLKAVSNEVVFGD